MVCVSILGVTSVIGFSLYHQYIPILTQPFQEQMYITQIEHGFTTRIKIAIYFGLITSFPAHLYHIIAFIIPALSNKERKVIIFFLFGSLVLLITGGILAYTRIIPLSINFLRNSSFFPENVSVWLNYRESLLFIFKLFLCFLAAFQLPLVLMILMMLNIVNRIWLLGRWREVIVAIFLLSAIVTPADIISQIGMALPLIFLFFLTIILAKILNLGVVTNQNNQ